MERFSLVLPSFKAYNSVCSINRYAASLRGVYTPCCRKEDVSAMSYRTVIFDLDGTLLDTLQDLADSANYALSVNALPQRSLEEIRSFVGNGVAMLIHRALPEGTSEELEHKCFSDFRAHYVLNMQNKTAPYPGILPLLRRLHAEGFQLAVVSNKFDDAVKDLCQSYFGSLFGAAIGESHGVSRKPAPDTVFKALQELGARAEDAVYVGDSDVDLLTARNAGLPCISVTWGFRTREFLLQNGAVQLSDSPEDLCRLLTD